MSKDSKKRQAALDYHTAGQPGKIEVVPTKMLSSQRDLSLAYSPGVAYPCLEIAANKEEVYKYTAKGNLVGVVSNGTAVLGLGNIGPEASKPVMEGKGVLFKKFAGIDVFDIEVDSTDPDEFINVVKALEPTFGGVNLEDIKAPESFKIEQELRQKMNIPVMHDDQHGTAIISAAALINALGIVGKKLDEVQIVVNGAGAAAVSCTLLYVSLGAKKENIVMCDSKGAIRKDRPELPVSKAQFATDRDVTDLASAMKGADVFIGLSMGNVVSPENLLSMTSDPIVFALANPDPEIAYDLAMSTRDDIIMATGRSDHPNQVNNVLGFPFIFRGALDSRATEINEEMKRATVLALAEMAKETVPEMVVKAYGGHAISFGRKYLIPKPLDSRLITRISPAVAKAAMESGVARQKITDWDEYEQDLLKRVGADQRLVSRLMSRVKENPKRVVFAEADHVKILRAAAIAQEEGMCEPILLGNKDKINRLITDHQIELENVQILDPQLEYEKRHAYGELLYKKRNRKGVNKNEGPKLMLGRNYFGAAMVEAGDADAMVSGLTRDYPSTISPALQLIGKREDSKRVAGMYIMQTKLGPLFFADTTLNIDPTAEELVDIAYSTSKVVKLLGYEPRLAMVSYSNFGSAKGAEPEKMALATKLIKKHHPDLIVDGEMQANIALSPELQQEIYPFSATAEKGANTLVFPNLSAGNSAYKLVMETGHTEAIGPVLLGMKKPVQILQLGSSVRDIVNMIAIAVLDAQSVE
ncbi:NADP-dependent malic enzyme [Cyclobacteriaceae bacterium]|nr:NADP-dependent malic enzyme [Cyclobacteriaceae bacterium]